MLTMLSLKIGSRKHRLKPLDSCYDAPDENLQSVFMVSAVNSDGLMSTGIDTARSPIELLVKIST